MKIEILKNADEIGKRAAAEFIKVINDNSQAVIGLATGSSPIKTYKELIKSYEKEEVSFEGVTTFNLDEYVGIDKTSEQSYFHFMNENLFKHINISMNHINIPSGTGELETICKEYDQKLKAQPIDIQILGIGTNGHIAFNEPGTSFEKKTHITTLAEQTISDNARFFSDISEVPTKAISMGLANIMEAKKIVLIATGESKASAVLGMIKEGKTENLPASILQDHQDVLILLDEAAASKL